MSYVIYTFRNIARYKYILMDDINNYTRVQIFNFQVIFRNGDLKEIAQ